MCVCLCLVLVTYPEPEEVPMVPARYHYRVYAHYQKEYESLQNTNYKVEVQRPKLKPTDRFKFHFNVLSRSIDHSNPTSSHSVVRLTTLLHHAQRVGCKRFFQQGHDFLRSQLSHPDFPSASIEQLIRKLVPEIQQLFDFDYVLDDNGVGKPCANSGDRSRQFVLFLKVVVDT